MSAVSTDIFPEILLLTTLTNCSLSTGVRSLFRSIRNCVYYSAVFSYFI